MTPTKTTVFDRFIVPGLQWFVTLSLATLVSYTAWDNGGAYQSTRFICLAGLLILSVFAAPVFWSQRGNRQGISVFVWLAMAAWIGGLLQTLPLPIALTELLSPGSATAFQDWASAHPDLPADSAKMSEARSWAPLSLSSDLTRQTLGSIASIALAIWLASVCLTDRKRIFVFLLTVATAGAFLSFFGLADAVILARDEVMELRQRLFVTPVGADGPFSTFVNNNNAGSFLLLTAACCFGLLTYLACKRRLSRSQHAADEQTEGALPWLWDPSAAANRWAALLLMLVITITLVGILASGSRGAFLGLLSGSLVCVIGSLRRSFDVGFVLKSALLLACVTGLLVATGMLDQTTDRLGTLLSDEVRSDPRIAHWKDSLNASAKYLPAGAGLGAYRYAYLPHQIEGSERWFLHADGMPMEWLLEGGIWLPLILLTGVVVALHKLWTSARIATSLSLDEQSIVTGLRVSVVFALAALAVSQCFDFGVLQPPLFLTLAILLGSLAGTCRRWSAASSTVDGTPQVRERSRFAKPNLLPQACVLFCLIACSLVSLGDLWSSTITQKYALERSRYLQRAPHEIPPLDEAIRDLQRLAEWQPRNASVHRLLSQYLVDSQRRAGAQYLVDQAAYSSDEARRFVAPRALSRIVRDSGNAITIDDLMLPGQSLKTWQAADRHAAMGLKHCPFDDSLRVMRLELQCMTNDPQVDRSEMLEQLRMLRRQNTRVQHFLTQLESDSQIATR